VAAAAAWDAEMAHGLCGSIEDELLHELELSAGGSARLQLPEPLLAEALPQALPTAPGAPESATAPSVAARKRPRCMACNCRLPLTATCASACQCGEIFCGHCMHAHECSFDYRGREQRKLKDDNPNMAPSKLERFG